jgi:hypothetical protein
LLEDEQSGHQPRRQRWLPWPDATDRTEAAGQELPVNFRRQTHQRMAKVDDLLQRWAKQIVLTIVARLAHGSPPTANLPSKESQSAEIRNPKTQENRDPPPAFLQNRILAQVKSLRCFNRFRILHGRPNSKLVSSHSFAISPRIPREFCWKRPALSNQRAQGMPGARCARSLVCSV